MARVTSLKPKYIPLFQKPCFCNVTCLQMVLHRRGCGLFDQEKMAKFFGVGVARKDAKCYTEKFRVVRDALDPLSGLATSQSAARTNAFFKRNNIGLAATGAYVSEINDLAEFLRKNIEQDNDLWFEYSIKGIHGNCDYEYHDGLVESVTVSGKKAYAIVMDPDPAHRSRFKIDIAVLRKAIFQDAKAKRKFGFIVISKK